MVALLRSLLKAFLYDEMAAKRWIRGSLSFAASIGSQLVIDPNWSLWTAHQWFVHAVPGLVSFVAGAVTAGDKTPANVKLLADQIDPRAAA